MCTSATRSAKEAWFPGGACGHGLGNEGHQNPKDVPRSRMSSNRASNPLQALASQRLAKPGVVSKSHIQNPARQPGTLQSATKGCPTSRLHGRRRGLPLELLLRVYSLDSGPEKQAPKNWRMTILPEKQAPKNWRTTILPEKQAPKNWRTTIPVTLLLVLLSMASSSPARFLLSCSLKSPDGPAFAGDTASSMTTGCSMSRSAYLLSRLSASSSRLRPFVDSARMASIRRRQVPL